MLARIALIAGLLVSTAATAEVLGTFTHHGQNSDEIVVSITNDKPASPYCKGKAAESVIVSGGMEFKFATGCWGVIKHGVLYVEMYTYSDGREISFPILMSELQLTPKFEAKLESMGLAKSTR